MDERVENTEMVEKDQNIDILYSISINILAPHLNNLSRIVQIQLTYI